MIVTGVFGCLMLAAALAAWDVFRARDDSGTSSERDSQAPTVSGDSALLVENRNSNVANARISSLIEDDGQTLWASPTSGKPLDLSYLPPGVQIVVAMRPEAIASHPEGEKVFASLGPLGEQARQFLNGVLKSPAGVDRCVVGCQANSDGTWHTTLVLQLGGGPTAAQHVAQLPDVETKKHGDTNYWLGNGWSYYTPPGDDPRLLIASSPELISEIIDLDGSPPPLHRDIERLLVHTDSDRHFTAIVAPSILFSVGDGIFAGPLDQLRQPLFWFFGDELSAASLSLNWDEDFFIELIATPTLDTSAEATARILRERVGQIPDRIENHVVGLDASPYARRLIARFPAMVRTAAAHTRAEFDRDHAMLRCYLPAVAGHNLLIGAELTLAESWGGPLVTDSAAQSSVGEPGAARSVRERLRETVSLSFPRDTLEAAVQQLGRQIGVTIEIVGADLQADGITKNQSFGIDANNTPAEQILVEILKLANPDKTATSPADIQQKLVYVIAPAATGQPERILITTRSGAAKRGDELPSVFRPE